MEKISKKFIELTKLNISVIIKAEEFYPEKIKIRLFCPKYIFMCDYYIYEYEFDNENLYTTICNLQKLLLEKIKIKNDEEKNRKKVIVRNSEKNNEETLFG